MAVNYERPPFSPQPKRKADEKPPVIAKRDNKRAEEAEAKKIKAHVRARDRACRVCLFRRSSEVHELRFRSLGGPVSLENSIGVCAARNSGLCHQLLGTHDIQYAFLQPTRGAEGRMRFSMNDSVAKAVFGNHVIPKHIVILDAPSQGVWKASQSHKGASE